MQTPVHRDVAIFVDGAALQSLHHDEGLKALEPARAKLEQAGIPTLVHIGVGDFDDVFVHYAKSLSAKEVSLTRTARNESNSANWMSRHMSVPVTAVG